MLRAYALVALVLLVLLFIPGPRLLRIGVGLAALCVLGWTIYVSTVQQGAREHTTEVSAAAEEERWSPSPVGLALTATRFAEALDFGTYSTVALRATVHSDMAGITGAGLEAIAYDCPEAGSPLVGCDLISTDEERQVFPPTLENETREITLRFRFDGLPMPRGVLRFSAALTEIRH